MHGTLSSLERLEPRGWRKGSRKANGRRHKSKPIITANAKKAEELQIKGIREAKSQMKGNDIDNTGGLTGLRSHAVSTKSACVSLCFQP